MYVCIQHHARGAGCRILICLWKPFGYCLSPVVKKYNWNPVNSIVHIFASFLLLSSTKILFVSMSLLQKGYYNNVSNYGRVVENNNHHLYDPSHTFLSHSLIPFAILAVVFVLFPALVVTPYPACPFQKFLNCCGISSHALHAFADAFNGCYKNGTNSKRDCHNFAGINLFVRVEYITFYAYLYNQGLCHIASCCQLFVCSSFH